MKAKLVLMLGDILAVFFFLLNLRFDLWFWTRSTEDVPPTIMHIIIVVYVPGTATTIYLLCIYLCVS